MADFKERRKYKRWYGPRCKALVSEDGKVWVSCEVSDISAGGLRFNGGKCFSIGQNIHFELAIYSCYSEFTMSLTAQVVHSKEMYFGVKFMNISKSQQIQLDEIITSAIGKNQENMNHHHKFEDGIYTFRFNPVRRRAVRIRKYL